MHKCPSRLAENSGPRRCESPVAMPCPPSYYTAIRAMYEYHWKFLFFHVSAVRDLLVNLIELSIRLDLPIDPFVGI